ncbi:MAG: hypothetical protein EB060_05770 [Proteobacteria bacterium]|nr:hypothetical protein [Pseudomonadota bacterium]
MVDKLILKPSDNAEIQITALSLLPKMATAMEKECRSLLDKKSFRHAEWPVRREKLIQLLESYFPEELLDEIQDDLLNKRNKVYAIGNLPTTSKKEIPKNRPVLVDNLVMGCISQAIMGRLEIDIVRSDVLVRQHGDRQSGKRIAGYFWHQDTQDVSAFGTELNLEEAPTSFRNMPAILRSLTERTRRLLAGHDDKEHTGTIEQVNNHLLYYGGSIDHEGGSGFSLNTTDKDAIDEWIAKSKENTLHRTSDRGELMLWVNRGELYHRGRWGEEKVAKKHPWTRVNTRVFGVLPEEQSKG